MQINVPGDSEWVSGMAVIIGSTMSSSLGFLSAVSSMPFHPVHSPREVLHGEGPAWSLGVLTERGILI